MVLTMLAIREDKRLQEALSRLERLVEEISALHSKLILLVGSPGSGKTALLGALAERMQLASLNVGAELGFRIAAIPHRQRCLQAGNMLRELADERTRFNIVLIDNIELLFDPTLQLNPLDLLRRLAHAKRIVAVWPGTLSNGRLTYADIGHPEHRDYGIEGLVTFETHQ